jgi:hypothetical protein
MFKFVSRWVARFFAPSLELIGRLPPGALNRIVVPF